MIHHPTRRPTNTSSIIGNTSKTTNMDIEDESYGTKYIRYLNKFRIEKTKVEKGKDLVDTIVEAINGSPEVVAEYKVRESILARAIIVQAQIEAGKRDRVHGERLAEEFVKAKMDNGLWYSIQAHLHCSDNNEDASAGRSSGGGSSPVVGVDELEMAVELLFIFSHWSLALKRKETVAPGAQSLLRACLAVELFSRYAARQSQPSLSSALSRRHHRAHGHQQQQQQQQPDVGRLQRIRLGHKALHLLDITWGILIGDEAEAMRRLSGSSNAEDAGSSVATRGLRPSGLARDALRQIRDSCERYPELSAEVNNDIERLLPFIHPFDGHLTRSAQLGRFGPISSSSRDQITAQQTADAVHSVSMPRESLAEGSRGTVPKAAREAVAAYVHAAQLTRSEREYGEWWRRLVGTRGWPMSLTINGGVRGNDIILNPLQQQQQQQHFHGGIIEAEDMAALELALDNKLDPCGWPPGTDSEPGAGARAAFYCALFPLLPVLCRALVRTIAAWAPAERELSAAPAPAGLVSEVSGLGIIAYPKWELPASAAAASAAAATAHLLGGSNVQRLDRTASRSASSSSINTASSNGNSSSSRSAKNGGGVVVVAGLAARLLTQYSQWEVTGRFLMRLLAGLQANHILQVGYVAQLLVNENIIPAIFWWLGTANLQLGISLPLAVRRRSFTAEYALELRRVDPQAVQSSSSFLSSASSSVLPAKQSALSWRPALQGLVDCCRVLHRLTAHDGMRKGLLYKNKALYFYSRVMSVPLLPLRRVVAELYRDIVPILSRAKKMAHMDILSCVFLYAPPLLSDSYWLSEYFVDPLVEMHRHVELLRLLHFYHFECFGLFLPQSSALFPSLVARVVDLPLKPADANTANTTSAAAGEIRPRSVPAGRHGRTASSGKYRRPGVVTPAPASCSLQSASAAGVLMSEHSWIKWDSELEETLNQVYINKS
ncbi:hypothetical protein BX661DRAFT_188752 [Kickxella alabastrina]|uniref:uncharacterized protein n=1 Tax=Kickxella alabastrina TaxID=61397 RepID=UPI0022204C61|nr:uncharacterized protein BX661DRAFT_188752 [Kickxella alabastrina]KAI7820896.1 hypothetical protein BX661DRAFT_188752 [Kickxella alabastrina]